MVLVGGQGYLFYAVFAVVVAVGWVDGWRGSFGYELVDAIFGRILFLLLIFSDSSHWLFDRWSLLKFIDKRHLQRMRLLIGSGGFSWGVGSVGAEDGGEGLGEGVQTGGRLCFEVMGFGSINGKRVLGSNSSGWGSYGHCPGYILVNVNKQKRKKSEKKALI